MPAITYRFPIRTVSETNQREHWSARHKRRKAQRKTVWAAMVGDNLPRPPCDIWLTRVAPRTMDCDNLCSSMKAVRDEIAAQMGIDDGRQDVVWKYLQRKGEPKEYAVICEIMTDGPNSRVPG